MVLRIIPFFLLLVVQPAYASLTGSWSNNDTSKVDEARGKIQGRVLDKETSNPLEYATISVLNQRDSTLVGGGISDLDGRFNIEVEFGLYLIKIDFLSYSPQYIENLVVNSGHKNVDVGTIYITPQTSVLDEVTVVAEKSEMQFGLDKRVFNVGRDLANKGGSAEDILDNIPSVTVDVEGNVALRGSENVRILINGKPSGLIGLGDSGGLKSLPAGMIESVEVVTNASARYEAEGTAGIINIVLKKDRSQGVNGSVDLSVGIPNTYGAALNMNARKGWINFFVNYGFRYREGPGEGYTNQTFYDNPTIPISNQLRTSNRGGVSNSLRGGMDLFLSDRDVITGAILYRYGNNFSDSKVEFFDYKADNTPLGITHRIQDETEKEPTLEYELNYERKFENKEQKFNIQFQYQNNEETEAADYIERYFDPEFVPTTIPNLLQRSNNQERQKDVLFKTDYSHPFGVNKKFEVGARISLRDIQNDYLVEELDENQWFKLTNVSNQFSYAEDIYAGYGIFSSKVNQWSYQLGLRAEHSRVLTKLVETNEVNDRSYTNLFPTLHLTYEINKGNALQASYSRRISRPRFWYLNPFFTYSNTRSLWGGNPNLDPELTDSYELNYLRYWENITLGTSLYYRHSTAVIERITRVIADGVTRTQPENLATQNSVGTELTLGYDMKKWWRLDASGNLYYSKTYGEFDSKVLEAKTLTWNSRWSSKVKFWKDAEFQVKFDYRAPRKTPQGRSKSIYSFDLAFSKDILKRNGTITISARDIFNTRKYRYEVFTDEFFSESLYQHRSRYVIFGFNYRLNQKKSRKRSDGPPMDGGEMF